MFGYFCILVCRVLEGRIDGMREWPVQKYKNTQKIKVHTKYLLAFWYFDILAWQTQTSGWW